MITITDRLSEEDLQCYRRIEARFMALKLNPRAYSAEESEEICYEWYVINGDLFARYEVDPEEDWRISPTDGTIYYEDT
jgi:hypothetical protein